MIQRIQVKICGLTNAEQAYKCAELGADAIGLVFYSKSPRYVTEDTAASIIASLPQHVKGVGVFVNESFSEIMKKVYRCGLKAVQLHGQESPELVKQLKDEKLIVIKALFANGVPSFGEAETYPASAFLVECGKGPLPGGNALSWNWKLARNVVQKYPVILAGGLVSDNVLYAVQSCCPDAVDVSSGVEFSPGHKDLIKVEAFLDSLSQCIITWKPRRIF